MVLDRIAGADPSVDLEGRKSVTIEFSFLRPKVDGGLPAVVTETTKELFKAPKNSLSTEGLRVLVSVDKELSRANEEIPSVSRILFLAHGSLGL